MLLESHATDQMVSRRERRHIFESLKVKDRPRQVCAKSQRRDAILKFGSVISAGLLFPEAAKAVRQIERSDGSLLDAFQFDIPLRVVSLAGSVPGDWEQEFKQVMRGRVQFKLERRAQLMDIYNELSRPQDKKSAATADIVSLGDAFLGPAIKNDLIQPIASFQDEAWWKLVNPRWQRLLRRDSQGVIDRNGQIYGVPFSWDATLIAYRNDKLTERQGGSMIRDWKDLLQPSLRGRLGMTGFSRELMAVVFKMLGLSANASQDKLEKCGISASDIRRQVSRLKAQILHVSEREAGLALQAGDAWATVGSSQDLIPLAQRHTNISLVAPESGTFLSGNIWVVPRFAQQKLSNGQIKAGTSPVLPSWFLFGLEPARASRRRGLQSGASPLLLPFSSTRPQCPNTMAEKTDTEWTNLELSKGDMLPTEEVLERSEFLEALDEETKELFWQVLQ